MKDMEYHNSMKEFNYKPSFTNQEGTPYDSSNHKSIIVHNNDIKTRKSRTYKLQKYTKQPTVIFHLSNFGSSKNRKHVTRHTSVPELMAKDKRKSKRKAKVRTKSCNAIPQTRYKMYYNKYVISEHRFDHSLTPFNNINQTNFKVYRCQLTSNNAENCDNCCCSCNSDTLFDVMKDLYACYKKRNCDNCNCILCCHLPHEERLTDTKLPCDLNAALREVANRGFALPEGKTQSERRLISKIRFEMGLPPEPKTPSMRDMYTNAANAGLMLPLGNNTLKQKEKILRNLANVGIPLPEGRTASEKALIRKIQEKLPLAIAPARDQREKILKELAMQGIHLPEGKTASEKILIEKVRTDLGLPPEPLTQTMRETYKKAACDGKLLPLEGKTLSEKEYILEHLYDMNIPLPKGRTRSEKALIDRIKARHRKPSLLEKLRRPSRAVSFLTDKKPTKSISEVSGTSARAISEVSEASIKRLSQVSEMLTKTISEVSSALRRERGSAISEELTPSKRGFQITEQDRTSMDISDESVDIHITGIPQQPIRQPIPKKKPIAEKISLSQKLPERIPVPEEISMSEEISMPEKRPISDRTFVSEEISMSSLLAGKSPSEQEILIHGLAERGLPLPKGTTSSDRLLINKYARAADAGLLEPLEGKSPEDREINLRGLYDLGIPLPKPRTPMEADIIHRIKEQPRAPARSRASSLLTSLKSKTITHKLKIQKGLAKYGINLPKEKAPSEDLTKKVRVGYGAQAESEASSLRDQIPKRKAESEASSDLRFEVRGQPRAPPKLQGKTDAQKKKILTGLAKQGIPLPEGKTPSEESLIEKVRIDYGLSMEPGTPPTRVKYQDRERTPSDKKLMFKLREEPRKPPQLQGKTPAQKEKILTGLARQGISLPEGKTPSEKKILMKIRDDLGLPPEPETPKMRKKYAKAAEAGILQPLEGKTPKQKEDILLDLQHMGIPLPEGRTPSDKALIAKVKSEPRQPSEKSRKTKLAGLFTPLKGKKPAQKEKLLISLAKQGVPLPEAKTVSDEKIIKKVRDDLGLPPEPKTPEMREKYDKAADAGILQPLEGKTPKQKQKILHDLQEMGIPLPEGRTPSDKALIAKVKSEPRVTPIQIPTKRKPKKQPSGLLTPLKGKTPKQKEKILTRLAKQGIPLPEGKTPSEKKMLIKVRDDLGLPPEPETQEMREKYAKAADAGILQPLEGKTPKEKEDILLDLQDMGIPLPEGRTPSDKAIIAKVKSEPRMPLILPPAEKKHKAKIAGLLTPLKGKKPKKKEKILTELAKQGMPLPEGKTPSEKKMLIKVRDDLGLPPEPKTPEMREKYGKAADAGKLQPLKGKTPRQKEKILLDLQNMGIPLPEGQTPSDKALIAKVKSEPRVTPPLTLADKKHRARAAGLLTPLMGKKPAQREKILTGLAEQGIPLPEAKTPSEKKAIAKVRDELGLPPEPKTPEMREKYDKAADAGILQPLKGKTPKQKQKILLDLQDMGIPLPEGRTPSDKALIAKVKSEPRMPIAPTPVEKKPRAKPAGLLTPLKAKTPEQKEVILTELAKKGIPLPEAKTVSDKKIVKKVRDDLGLPPEPKTPEMRAKYAKAADAGILQPLEGKTPKEKQKILIDLQDMGIPLPEGRTPSDKAIIAKVKSKFQAPPILTPAEKKRKAKLAGLLTPLKAKTPKQKEEILTGLAKQGIPLPEAKTVSDKKIVKKVRDDLGLPPEPKTPEMREKYAKAADAGILQPLEGKTPKQKQKILIDLQDMGIPLPEGRTSSDKALIAKVKSKSRTPPLLTPAEKKQKAKLAGLLTPLKAKTPRQKEEILTGLAKQGIPLPEAKTVSDKRIVKKVRDDLGLPPEPKTPEMRAKYAKAADAGILQPLEGKTPKQKQKILLDLQNMGIPLPEGRTPSDKALIAKVKSEPRVPPTQKQRADTGLLTPLKGKKPEQKEKILTRLATQGISLPEGKTPSETKIIKKVRDDLGLPPEPETPEMRERYAEAADAGLFQPLEGKTKKQKQKILIDLQDMGIPLPEGRTPSDKALIAKVKSEPRTSPMQAPLARRPRARKPEVPSLKDKTPEQKRIIVTGLAKQGKPLPEGKSPSETKIIRKVREDLGLPPEPETPEMRERYAEAADAGLLQPLEGKTKKQKQKILIDLQDMGIPLPEGRTPSDKALIAKVKSEPRTPPMQPSPVRRPRARAREVSPLGDKTPEQKRIIVTGLAKQGKPLPEGKTPSETKIIRKVREDLGLPPEPETPEMRERYAEAADAGLLQPLEGKTKKQKQRILIDLRDMGIPLPEGRTSSDKALIAKVKSEPRTQTPPVRRPRARAREVSPLRDKTPEQKRIIVTGLAKQGKPLPEGKTPSETKIIRKVREDLGLPPEPETPEMRERYEEAADAGLLQPLEGKTKKQKQKILIDLQDMGIPLPEGRTSSDKALIAKVKSEPRTPPMQPSPVRRPRARAREVSPLRDKTPEQKRIIVTGLAKQGKPLPQGKTPSETKIIKKVREDLGLPPEPETPEMRKRYEEAADAGLLQPLEGKTKKQKQKILIDLQDMGIPLPEGRTSSDKALIAKVKSEPRTQTPPVRRPRARAREVSPLRDKTPEQKRIIVTGLAKQGKPLPEGKTPSESKIIRKVREDLGLPPEPETPEMRERYAEAADAGLLQPLEGKTKKQKQKILIDLQDMGIPLPEGRTSSDKALIAKVKSEPRTQTPPVRRPRARAREVSPLRDKTPEQKRIIVTGLAKQGKPLPQGKTPSDTKIIRKVREDLGLPPEPETPEMRERYEEAADAGLLQPLEGKTKKQKQKILIDLQDMGIPLPEGRTSSDKALIAKVKSEPRTPPMQAPPVRRPRAREVSPLRDKTPEQKRIIVTGLAKQGKPLPEGKTPSETKIIRKVREDLGLPPEPETPEMRERYAEAADAGLLQPLEGKTKKQKQKILIDLQDMGIPLPEGRTSSDKALIAKVKSEPRTQTPPVRKPRPRAPEISPLRDKTPEQKRIIVTGLAKQGKPLPEGKTPSETNIIRKVRDDLGLPPEPETPEMRERYAEAADAGLLQPLEGKTKKQKQRILIDLRDMGIPLPEGRTSSDKALIEKIKSEPHTPPLVSPAVKKQRAKAAGLLTPLKGKKPDQREKILTGLAKQGLPLPEGKTPSEKEMVSKVRDNLGLPPEPETPEMRKRYSEAADAGILQPLKGKTKKQKQKILIDLRDMGIPLPEGRTPSDKALIAKVKSEPRTPPVQAPPIKRPRARAPEVPALKDKTPEQKRIIVTGLAKQGIPLPEGKTPSEEKIIKRVREDLGLPPEPETPEMRERYAEAADAGLLQPLEGKTKKQKQKILIDLQDMGIPLPEGRTSSDKALIAKVKSEPRRPPAQAPPIRKPRARAPEVSLLSDKSPEQRRIIVTGLAKQGKPLPEGKTPSETKIIRKVRADLGLPPEPETPEMRERYAEAADAGLLQPLEGKTKKQKQKILIDLQDMGIPLPEGRTSSDKALIAKVKSEPRRPPTQAPPIRKPRARAPEVSLLSDKSPEQRRIIVTGLAKQGKPLPEGKTPSETKIIRKVREDLGLPPEPESPEMRERYAEAADAGLLQPLEGKTKKQKQKILIDLQDMGIPLPEGRTPSDKALIAKVKSEPRTPPMQPPTVRKPRARAPEVSPLRDKTPEQRRIIVTGLAKQGMPLPEGKTPSETKIIKKVRDDLGLPPEPETPEMRERYAEAADAGLLQPLEGKTKKQKQKILIDLRDMGIPLPEGRTPSDKALIEKVKSEARSPPVLSPVEKKRKADAAGLLTPLKGKKPEQKEKILTGLAKQGIPLPEGKTPSETKIIRKVRDDLGLPPEPETPEMRKRYSEAADAGLLQPLEGKTKKQKQKILIDLRDMGIPLPEGRTPSDKALIAKVKSEPRIPATQAPPLKKLKAKTPEASHLEDKTLEQRRIIVTGLAKQGMPLPEGKTPSDKKIIKKVRDDLGLPPEPETPEMRKKYAEAADAGILQPLEGKTKKQKQKILIDLRDMGIPLPEGRTASDKALIAKVKSETPPPITLTPTEKKHKAKAAGLLTPLKGKKPEQKEKILKGLAKQGLPLPEVKTPSDRKLITKVRDDLGLPPEPETPEMRKKYAEAASAGLLQPLEGKTKKQKQKILIDLRNMGIPLPEGRTPSDKALIAKVKSETTPILTPAEKKYKAKTEGLLTPLKDKKPEQKEKILTRLAKQGIPLPEGKTPSEKKILRKVRDDLGLPPEPETPEMRDRYAKAADAGILQPLEGKTKKQKQKILIDLRNMGIPLPEAHTPSDKALIAKVKAEHIPLIPSPSKIKRKDKTAGLLSPLKGKSPEEKEKQLTALAMKGKSLPEGKSPSDKNIIKKVRNKLGLPPEPKSPAMRDKYDRTADAGLMHPLEGKTTKQKQKILNDFLDNEIPLPEGRTPSEKALIAKVKSEPRPLLDLTPSEKMRKAKAAGLLTPLKDKSPEEREKQLTALAMQGRSLPEGKTPSDKNIIKKVRNKLGLPPEPKSPSMRDKYDRAADAGLMHPLEGKSIKEKQKILNDFLDNEIPLPEGRTPSEKALIAKVKSEPRPPLGLTPSEKIRRAKAAGLLSPLKEKSPEEKEKQLTALAMKGKSLPEGKSPSDKNIIKKVRNKLGLPPEPKSPSMRDKYDRMADAGLMHPLEGKSIKEKQKILNDFLDNEIPLPEGRTPSEKALIAKVKSEPRPPLGLTPSEKIRRAKAAGLLSPLKGKSPEEKEKQLTALAMKGKSLPEGKSPSDKNIIKKVRNKLGLPPEPKSPSMRDKYDRVADAGLMHPLEGKSTKQKQKILNDFLDNGIPLPEGRTPSEKALIAKVKSEPRAPLGLTPSEKMRRAKAAGLLTPLKTRTPEEREKQLTALAMQGMSLPEGKTSSDKNIIKNVRKKIGLPPEPKSPSMRDKYDRAADSGLMHPLEGKSIKQKQKILSDFLDRGIPLPEGRTPSEKALIAKVKSEPHAPLGLTPSEKMRRAKAAGLLTPLKGKSPEEREKQLTALAMQGMSLPEGKTPSDKNIIKKVRKNLGLPPEPKSPSMRDKYDRAADAGIMHPLEGKSTKQKQKILNDFLDNGIPLPEGRTPSEKALIAKVKSEPRAPPGLSPSEKMRRAKAGLLTPLKGKSPEEMEKQLTALAMQGMSLPEGKTPSEKNIIKNVRNKLALPPEPKTPSMRDKYDKAANAGQMQPLEGKSTKKKKKILNDFLGIGIPLPEGRTPSEKALIAQVKASAQTPSVSSEKIRVAKEKSASEKLKVAKAAGFLTPLKGKSAAQKEKILKGLAKLGLPLPKGKTPSEKELIDKIRAKTGLPPEPKTESLREKYNKAHAAGIITPLESKTDAEKEKILNRLLKAGIPLPVGRTSSEKALVKKVKSGLGKTPEEKEKYLRGLIKSGRSLPKVKTPSDANLIKKIQAEMGLPPKSKSASVSEKTSEPEIAGLLTPLEGRTLEEKARILKALIDAGIPLPDGRTPSERSLIAKLRERGPLAGKSPEEKEKIMKNFAAQGLPVPEGTTPSEKKLAAKVRKEIGLPPGPTSEHLKHKMRKAHNAGIITPLEGKTPIEKEKVLKNLVAAGIPLPEGRTPSEKDMIKKVKALKPFADKTPEEKEKFLKKLAANGLPLPEATTTSEKKLDTKVRKEIALPPEPKTAPMKEKMQKAYNAGLIYPLGDKTPEQKEKILKGLVDAGIPLPEGRTPSEKALIKKIQALGPLAGKTSNEKEKALKRLAAYGLPLPEGTTTSDKQLAAKIEKEPVTDLITSMKRLLSADKERTDKDLGKEGLILPEGKTVSEKSLLKKIQTKYAPLAKRFEKESIPKDKMGDVHLEGKTASHKEKVLRGLAKIGFPLPEGTTASERELIKKVQADMPSEIEKKSCSRACGCDKKKIRFKHSYVKIKVTSPDMDSICPCPDECIPHIKSGIHLDEYIHVTVETATGVPQYPRSYSTANLVHWDHRSHKKNISNSNISGTSTDSVEILFNKNSKQCDLLKSIYKEFNLQYDLGTAGLRYFYNAGSYDKCNYPFEYNSKRVTSDSQHSITTSKRGSNLSESIDFYKTLDSIYYVATNSSQSSIDSIFIIKSETSLSFSSSCEDVHCDNDDILVEDALTSNITTLYLQPSSDVNFSNTTIEETELRGHSYCSVSMIASRSDCSLRTNPERTHASTRDDVFQIFQMSQTNLNNPHEMKRNDNTKTGAPVVVINEINSDLDITAVIEELLAKEEFCDVSSLFVVVSTSDDEDERKKLSPLNSATCIQLSKNFHNWRKTHDVDPCFPQKRTSNTSGLRVSTKGKKYLLEGVPTTAISACSKQQNISYDNLRCEVCTKDQSCQVNTPEQFIKKAESTDTTEDRPCCCICLQRRCASTESEPDHKDACVENAMSEMISVPVHINQLRGQGNSSECCIRPKLECCIRPKLECAATQQSNVTLIKSSSSDGPQGINIVCSGHSGCVVPTRMLKSPPSSPLPPALAELKKLLERPCECSPEKMRQYFAQAQGQMLRKTKDMGCGPEQPPRIPSQLLNAVKKYKFKMKDIKQQSSGQDVTRNNMNPVMGDRCCPCPVTTKKPNEIKAKPKPKPAAKPKKKVNVVGVQCECVLPPKPGLIDQVIPKIGQATPSPFNAPGGPVSTSIQIGPGCAVCPSGLPCSSPHSTCPKTTIKTKTLPPKMGFYGQPSQQREMVQIEIIGPLGGLSGVGSAGTFTQAGLIKIRQSTGAEVNDPGIPDITQKKGKASNKKDIAKNKTDACTCAEKPKRKKGKIICECPPPLPEPEPEPEPQPLTEEDYEYLRRNVAMMKSDLTQTMSGFKFEKSKKPPEEDWTVEDSIRYYASINPKFISGLVPPVVIVKPRKEDCECDDEKYKTKKSGIDCLCPPEPEPTPEPEPEPVVPESPFRGLKFKMGGKGSGSKGLTGICCFDMLQE